MGVRWAIPALAQEPWARRRPCCVVAYRPPATLRNPSMYRELVDSLSDQPLFLTRYSAIRALTEQLASPLSPEDQCVQSMPDASPTKWHLAHTTWFFETFVLKPHADGYEPYNAAYAHLFNSYYESVGTRHPRPQRGLLTRPAVSDVLAYRRHVDEAIARLFQSASLTERAQFEDLAEL